MALDFSNRNPQDPNGVFSLDTQGATDAWVNDDWSQVAYSQSEARKIGANNKVRIATAITNDGKKYNVVVGGDGQPISQIGDTTGYDDDRLAVWGRENPTTRPAARPSNVYIGTNPQTGKPTQVSEYPDGHKEYDDTAVPAAQSGTAKPPETKDEGGRRYVWKPNPGGPNAGGTWEDVGAAPLTPAEQAAADKNRPQIDRQPYKGKPGVWVVKSTSPQTGVAETHFENDAGQKIPTPTDDPNDTATVVTRNGRTYIQHSIPGANGKPAQIYHTDQQGNRVELPAEATPGVTAKNVEPFTPDPSQPDLGLGAWVNKHLSKIGLPPEQGGITQADWDRVATAARDTAQTYITNVTANENVKRTRYIDEQNQRKTLSDQGASDFKMANDTFESTLKYANPNTNAKFSTVPYLMAQAAEARRQREGTATPPPPLHPMFTGMATAAGVNPNSSGPPAAPTPPNALGLGQGVGTGPPLPSTPAPTAPVQAAGVAPVAPAPVPVTPLPPAAPYSPPPLDNVPMPPRVVPLSPRVTPPGVETPALPGDPGYGQPLRPASPPAAVPGAPTQYGDAGDTVQMAPGPVTSWAMRALAPEQQQPVQQQQVEAPAPTNPALVSLQQQAQMPIADPWSLAGRLVQMGASSESVAQAMRELGLDQQPGAA